MKLRLTTRQADLLSELLEWYIEVPVLQDDVVDHFDPLSVVAHQVRRQLHNKRMPPHLRLEAWTPAECQQHR